MTTDKYYERDFYESKYLASGGCGAVHRARHHMFCHEVALKYGKPQAIVLTKAEIEYMVQLRHENIVQFYGILVDSRDNAIGYVMKYMADGSVHNVVHGDKSYQLKQAYEWIGHAAAGIAYLHQKRIVHRDVKPLNMLLSNNKKLASICDFGLCRDEQGMTSHTYGTGLYKSPEACNDPKSLSYPTDVWSMGVSMWEILRKRHPSYPNTDGSVNLEWSTRSDKETGELLKKMVAIAPNDRPSMREVMDFALAKSKTCGSGTIRTSVDKSLQSLSLGSNSPSGSNSLEGKKKAATVDTWMTITNTLSKQSADRPDVLQLANQTKEATDKIKSMNRLRSPTSIEQCLEAVRKLIKNCFAAAQKALQFDPESLVTYEQEGSEVLATFEEKAKNKLESLVKKIPA